MSLRAHAALWIAAVALAALLVDVGASATLPRIQDDSTAAALAAGFPDSFRFGLDPGWLVSELQLSTRVLHFLQALQDMAGRIASWSPVIVAGLMDGLMARRARRHSFGAEPVLRRCLGSHLVLALGFAPILAAALGIRLVSLGLAAWVIALSTALSFSLRQVQGLGLRD